MGTNIKTIATAVTATLAITAASNVRAQDNWWEFSVGPYLWAAGLDADVTIVNRSASVERDFSDIADAIDIGGGVMAGARLGRFVTVTQLDYLALDSSNLDDAPARGELETDMSMGMLAMGVRLGNLETERHVDLLVGGRYLSLENELTLNGIGTFNRDKDYLDPIIMLRPSLPLGKRWRLNATMSYGEGGDSEKTWELQPHIEFRFTDNFAARFGYRRLYYEIESDSGANAFDGSFQGLIIGIGGTFGRPSMTAKTAPELPPAPAPTPVVAAAPPAPSPPPPQDTDGDGVTDNLDKCPSTARGEKIDPVGCAYNVRVNVLFESNSANLASESHAELDRLVVALDSTPTLSAIIEGHTDSSGADAYNQKLSERRAQSVADYLTSRGVSSSRLTAQGFGESKPIADNSTPDGRAQNRRVVLRRPDAD